MRKMRPARKMAAFIEALAKAFALPLDAPLAHFRFSKPGYQDLVIEKHAPHILALMHVRDDGQVDPLIRFHWEPYTHTAYDKKTRLLREVTETLCLPLEVQMAIKPGVTQVYAGVVSAGWKFFPAQQNDLTSFANTVWAPNLRAQGWLKGATLKNAFVLSPHSLYVLDTDETVTAVTQCPQDDATGTSLSKWQELVGGYIEMLPLRFEDGLRVTMTPFSTTAPVKRQWDMLGDEEARFPEDAQTNWIATRFSGIDAYGQDIVGKVVLAPAGWLK